MFNCEPGHPNVVEPGKRPRTTLVNYIVAKDGQPVMTVGCPGGDNQVQGNLQLILNSLVFGMDPQQAVESPRFATSSNVNSFYPHEYFPGQLDLEGGIPQRTADALKVFGHRIRRTANCGLGATVSARDLKDSLAQHRRRPPPRVLRAGALGRVDKSETALSHQTARITIFFNHSLSSNVASR